MIIFDMDGTLSIVGDRIKYLQQEKKDWDAFYEACGEDTVNGPISEIYRMFFVANIHPIKIVTGRRESTRHKTLTWLDNHDIPVRSADLHMRKDGDYRHDTIVKPELVEDFRSDILVVFEDRNSMVAKWRSLGICCCQVADGDF